MYKKHTLRLFFKNPFPSFKPKTFEIYHKLTEKYWKDGYQDHILKLHVQRT
jgi:hypothetical protein